VRSCDKEENMKHNDTFSFQRGHSWFGLLVVVVGALMLLSACGSSFSPGASVAASTTTSQTPISVASSPTPIPTIAQTMPTPAPGSTQMLMINNESNGSFGFSPAMLTIRVGTTVIWKNMSLAPHTVTSDDGQTFDSGTVAVGSNFRFTFKNAGTFSYHCNIHPYMRATIVVV